LHGRDVHYCILSYGIFTLLLRKCGRGGVETLSLQKCANWQAGSSCEPGGLGLKGDGRGHDGDRDSEE
jgi:hypothetical protein